MNRKTIMAAQAEAREFIRRADVVLDQYREGKANNPHTWYQAEPGYTRECGDLKRQSMELTRALVWMRARS